MARNYDHTTIPVFNSSGSSKQIRDEFDKVEAGFTATDVEMDAKAAKGGDTYTGAHDFTGAAVTVAAPTASAHPVTKLYADALSMNAALPGQTGNPGKFLKTDGSNASWSEPAPAAVSVEVRASNTPLAAADRGKMIAFSGGSIITQTFASSSSLGDGWWCYIKNPTAVPWGLAPNGSETIDGMTLFYMYPNEMRLVYCDGIGLYSIVVTPFFYSYYAADVFAKPPGYSMFHCRMWGGGASGRKDTTASPVIRIGGGGGACCDFDIPVYVLGASETITIGASVAGPTTTSDGIDGNDSSFAGITAYGGAKGGAGTGGNGGGAFADPWNNIQSVLSGTSVGTSYLGGCQSTSTGNSLSIYGGAAGGAIDAADVVRTHTSIFGGAGGAASLTVSGGDGAVPGGGGGSTKAGTKAGDGAGGALLIWGVV